MANSFHFIFILISSLNRLFFITFFTSLFITLFISGCLVANTLASTSYLLGPGDQIEITVFRHDELSKSVWLDPSGKILHPLAGEIEAAGLTIFALSEKIKERLSKYLVDPVVSVNVISAQNQTVAVLGEVNKPGFFPLNHPLTILEIISMSGGFTSKANQSAILLMRKGPLGQADFKTLNLNKTVQEMDLSSNIELQKGDIVYVPESFF